MGISNCKQVLEVECKINHIEMVNPQTKNAPSILWHAKIATHPGP